MLEYKERILCSCRKDKEENKHPNGSKKLKLEQDPIKEVIPVVPRIEFSK
jgi:hypothetical protein